MGAPGVFQNFTLAPQPGPGNELQWAPMPPAEHGHIMNPATMNYPAPLSANALSAADQPVRMAYLVSRYPAVSHTFILREVRALREMGFEIETASVNAPDRNASAMTEDEREEMARTYYIKGHGIGGALVAHLWGLARPLGYLRGLHYALSLGGWNLHRTLYGFFYFTEALMVARWMGRHQLKHLHVHFAMAAANVALVLKRAFGLGLSMTVHGPDEFYDVPGQQLEAKIDAADFMVCIGRFARSQLMKLSPSRLWDKFSVCPLGVDSHRYAPRPRSAVTGPFNLLCVGRLTPAKGQGVLIEAAARLRDWGRDFRVVLVGAGPDEAELKASVRALGLESQVEFTGPLNQEEVQARYAQADAFVLPSFAEGIPVVLMEAMASGVPCVTTRITGIPELIRDGVDGLLVTPSDALELADTVTHLMDDPDLCRELGEAGRRRVEAEYELSRNVRRLGSLFKARLVPLAC